MSVRCIDNNCINVGIDKCLHPLFEIFTNTYRCTRTKASARIARGVREVLSFHDVFHRDQTAKRAVGVNERKFFDSMLLQDVSRGIERCAYIGRDQIG